MSIFAWVTFSCVLVACIFVFVKPFRIRSPSLNFSNVVECYPVCCPISTPVGGHSSLDGFLHKMWWMKMQNNLFIYSLRPASLVSKSVGTHQDSFVVVSLPGRRSPRHTAIRQSFRPHLPFSNDAFNFHRAKTREHIAFLTYDDNSRQCSCECSVHDSMQHLLLINVAPIGYLSSMIVPFWKQNLSQWLIPEALEIALTVASQLSDRTIRMGYNGLGAGASVNHLHFQLWQFPKELPMEGATRRIILKRPLEGNGNSEITFVISELRDYFVRGIVIHDGASDSQRKASADIICSCQSYLSKIQITVNILVSPRGHRKDVYLFPRKMLVVHSQYGIPAGYPEIAGYVIMLNESDYKNVNAKSLSDYFRNDVSISQPQFEEFLNNCIFSKFAKMNDEPD